MKNTPFTRFVATVREIPLPAVLCSAAAVIVTDRFAGQVSAPDGTNALPFLIWLYGSILAALIFSLGWLSAKKRYAEKTARKKRELQRRKLAYTYRREYYDVLKSIS